MSFNSEDRENLTFESNQAHEQSRLTKIYAISKAHRGKAAGFPSIIPIDVGILIKRNRRYETVFDVPEQEKIILKNL